jgi:hypothetical protein
VRAWAVHTDRITGKQYVFAGGTSSIFSGSYSMRTCSLRFGTREPFKLSNGSSTPPSGRVTSFAECNGKLYASYANLIFEPYVPHVSG